MSALKVFDGSWNATSPELSRCRSLRVHISSEIVLLDHIGTCLVLGHSEMLIGSIHRVPPYGYPQALDVISNLVV